jgi:hypothetical protein
MSLFRREHLCSLLRKHIPHTWEMFSHAFPQNSPQKKEHGETFPQVLPTQSMIIT